MDTSNEASPRTQIIAPILSLDPDELGRKVREIWIVWAKEQPNPKLSWLKPWEELSEPDKEVDRRIGMQIAVGVVARLRRNLDNAREAHDMQLAAIMTATFQNTVSTIKDRIGSDNPYWTVAYGDVCRAVDREMALRDELAPYKLEPLALALRFHEVYERLAPSFGYETRTETRVFDPESKNGKLMVAVCAELFARK